jgi:DtxR family transcriptional regulator, Mn-dependent transcriptional regulator
MNAQRPTSTVEDYLQLIYIMQREGEDVIAARLKERKGVSAPTAWATLKRMERDGLIILSEHHRIDLTPAGLEQAQSIIRRHMLAERLLTDILKLEWAEVHDEAHRIEHAISPIIERQIRLLLDDPKTCPHGNPIPGMNYESPAGGTYALRDVKAGASVQINNIAEHAEEDGDLMHYLQRSGLVPGARLHVDEVEVSNATITVSFEGQQDRRVTVGLATAELLLVRAGS